MIVKAFNGQTKAPGQYAIAAAKIYHNERLCDSTEVSLTL